MNGKKKPKQKTKDEHVLEYLDDLEKDLNSVKLAIEKKDQQNIKSNKNWIPEII